MDVLEDAALKGDTEALTELIDRRLCGEHLNLPINRLAGEAPYEAVVRLHDDARTRRRVHSAIQNLTSEIVPARVAALRTQSSRAAAAAWLVEYFALVEATNQSGAPALAEVYEDLGRIKPRVGVIHEVRMAAFRSLASSRHFQDTYIDFIDLAFHGIEVASDLAITMAELTSAEFLSVVAPHIMTHYADDEALGREDFTFITRCLLTALTTLRSEDRSPLSNGLSEFLRHAATKASHRNGLYIRDAVVAGLSQSTESVNVLQRFEEAYWVAHRESDLVQLAPFPAEREWLSKSIQRTLTYENGGPTALAINPIPYAESGYFALFRSVMRIAFNIDINVHDIEYENVLSALNKRKIDLAVHNEHLPLQRAPTHANEVLLQSPPLIEFKSYDVLASLTRLEQLSTDPSLSAGAKALVEMMFVGNAPAAPGLDPIWQVPLAELVARGGLSYLGNTDTEMAARRYFGQLPASQDFDPDEGLEWLLDGRTAFYVGGALQAHYAMSTCPSRVIRVHEIEKTTNVHFFTLSQNYKNHKDLLDHCVRAWSLVKTYWPRLVDPTNASDKARDLFSHLRESIYLQINRDKASRCAFVRSFDDLAALLARHDTLLEPGREGILFRPTPDKGEEGVVPIGKAESARGA